MTDVASHSAIYADGAFLCTSKCKCNIMNETSFSGACLAKSFRGKWYICIAGMGDAGRKAQWQRENSLLACL